MYNTCTQADTQAQANLHTTPRKAFSHSILFFNELRISRQRVLKGVLTFLAQRSVLAEQIKNLLS